MASKINDAMELLEKLRQKIPVSSPSIQKYLLWGDGNTMLILKTMKEQATDNRSLFDPILGQQLVNEVLNFEI